MPRPSDYWRVPVAIDRLRMYGTWVAVKEELEEQERNGLVLPSKSVTTIGRVVAVGSSTSERYGVKPGDRVIYEQWQGGRWCIGDEKVLIMDAEHILAVVE